MQKDGFVIHPLKKKWQNPEIIAISERIEGGNHTTLHEGNFTPNHSHYHTAGGGSVPATPNAYNFFS